MFYIVSGSDITAKGAENYYTKFPNEELARIFCEAYNKSLGQEKMKVYQFIPARIVEIVDKDKEPTYDKT